MMKHLKNIKYYFIPLLVIWLSPQLISQKLAQQPTAENRKPVQVIVSGNHPDAIDNGETVIYDNRKGIDLRSFERPIKTTVPSLGSEPDADPVNHPGESPSEHGEKFQEVPGRSKLNYMKVHCGYKWTMPLCRRILMPNRNHRRA